MDVDLINNMDLKSLTLTVPFRVRPLLDIYSLFSTSRSVQYGPGEESTKVWYGPDDLYPFLSSSKSLMELNKQKLDILYTKETRDF